MVKKTVVTASMIAGALVVGFASCESPTAPAPEMIDALPRALTANEVEVLGASNDFAFRLLKQVIAVSPARENVVISPLSVSLALGMAANGARGETLEAMEEVLGTPHLNREEANEAYRSLADLLLSLDPKVELDISNSVWVDHQFPVIPAFVERVQTYFDAQARNLDFDDPGAVDVINRWVRERTRGRIDQIIDKILPDDVLYLINAVYFKGAWRSRFDSEETRPGAFVLEDGASVDVPFMAQEDVGGLYYRGDGVGIADLPFGGKAFSMMFVVPTKGTLTELLETLTRDRWTAWMNLLEENGYLVRLPRFELEYATNLSEALDRMGMGIAFSDTEADFWDLGTTSERIVMDRVKHKTFLKVDEQGTEAAGVTFTGFVLTSGGGGPMTFSVDRPFLLAIRERLSGTILFLGAVYNPS